MAARTSTEFLRFGAVGSVGFVCDGGLLWIFITTGMAPYSARLMSFPIAVLVTWWLNRNWTFDKASRARPIVQLNRYFVVQLVGTASNYAVYAMFIGFFEPTVPYAMMGFALGSAMGMFVNFFGARLIVFGS